jgi:nicotinamidase-related amidase
MDKTDKTALIVMDVQENVVPAFGGGPELMANVNEAMAAARRQGVPVLLGRVAFRSGYPEICGRNSLFSRMKEMVDFTEEASGLHTDLDRAESDIEFTKRRVSSFAGSDLDQMLRALEVEHLVLAGVATSGLVLSTLREASDLDYEVTVLADACADGDEEVHRVLTTRVFPMQAQVMSTREWSESN